MTDSASIQVDPKLIIHLRDGLARVRDELAEHIQILGYSPRAGSKAEHEVRHFTRAESLHTAHGQAWVLVEVAADQLTAYVKTITEPIETIAPYTCARAFLEASALACWLLDPSIDASSRVARSLALRFEGMLQQVRWARAAGVDESKAIRRLADIAALAESLGYPALSDRRGNPSGAGQRMPSVTQVIGETLNEDDTYRLLSAIAHGHHWALQHLSFVPAPERDETSSLSGTRLFGLGKGGNLTGLALMTLTTAKCMARVVWYQGMYLGWDLVALASLLDAGFDRLGASDQARVWRSGA